MCVSLSVCVCKMGPGVVVAGDGAGLQCACSSAYAGVPRTCQLFTDHVCVCCPALTAGTLFASTRHTVAFSPGNKGWVINEGDWPGQLLSFVLDSDGAHWRGIKVGCWLSAAVALLCNHIVPVPSTLLISMRHAQPMWCLQLSVFFIFVDGKG